MKIKKIVLRGGKKDVTYIDDSGKEYKEKFPGTARTAEIVKALSEKSQKPDATTDKSKKPDATAGGAK
ncbi:MAG: hypothetical protein PHH77_07705 [Victivallaceae bacterium]|nr:hypothetical protein [Victivallaceae bacterium]